MFQLENGSARIEAFGNPVLRTTSAAPVREADDVAFVLDADDKVRDIYVRLGFPRIVRLK